MMKKYLLLAVSALVGLTASAQGWTKPTIEQYSPMVEDDTVYLYNVGSQLFLTQQSNSSAKSTVADVASALMVSKYQTEKVVSGSSVVSWTSTEDDYFGNEGTIALKGVTLTLGDPNDGTTTWSWHAGNAGSLANHMPTTDGTVETLITEFSEEAPFGTLPTHGCFVKAEPTAKGKLTFAGKPSSGEGQSLVLVTASKTDPTQMLAAQVTPFESGVTEWTYDVDDAHVYYFFQLAHPNQLKSWRFTLRSVTFAPEGESMEKEYEWDGKSYTLSAALPEAKKFTGMYVKSNAGYSMYGEAYMNGSNTDNGLWTFEQQGDGTYRFHVSSANADYTPTSYPDCWVGVIAVDGELMTDVFPLIDMNEPMPSINYHLNWAFVTKDTYATYLTQLRTYQAAVALKAKIDECQERGLDVTSLQQVYANTASTLEQLQAATKQAWDLIAAADEQTVTPGSPKDMTDCIVNPNFDEGLTGWLCEYTGPRKNDVPKADPGWSPINVEGVMVAPSMSMWLAGQTSDVWQTINDLPNGIYKVSVGYWADTNGPVFYANDAKADMLKDYSSTRQELLTYVGDHTLTFGFRAPAVTPNVWYMADNWQLEYFGNGYDACKMYVDRTLADADSYSGVPSYRPLREAYQQQLSILKKATDKETLLPALTEFAQLSDQMKQNVAAYAAYVELTQQGDRMVEEGKYVGVELDLLADYVQGDEAPSEDYPEYPNGMAGYILYEGSLTTDEIIAETERLQAMIQSVLDNCMTAGADATAKLQNPNFDEGISGWHYDKTLGTPVAGGAKSNPNAERWNENFDIYQEVLLPNGVYRVDAQALYRPGANADEAPAWEAGTPSEVLTYLYANTFQTAVQSVYATPKADGFFQTTSGTNLYQMTDGTFVPNSMTTASEAFSAGLYENSVLGVVWNGTLRLGVRSFEGSTADRWSIWDNFRLTYLGMEAEPIAQCYDHTVADAEQMLNSGNLSEEQVLQLSDLLDLPVNRNDADATLKTIAQIRAAMDGIDDMLTDIVAPLNDKGKMTNDDIVGIYSLDGHRQPALQQGINIVKYSDGKTKKVLVK